MIQIKPKKIERIICMTEETTETLYALGAQDLIIGISDYTVRPPQAPEEKPKISRFLDARIDKIIELKPDLVLAWSDLQADIVKELIKEGIEVICFNHRSVNGILGMIERLGFIVNKHDEALIYSRELQNELNHIQDEASKFEKRPKVYFEEWFDPLISGIQWVSELIDLAGGDDVFKELSTSSLAKGRIIADQNEVIKRNPDIILASWCGKPVRFKKMLKREGWDQIPAIQNEQIFEIGSDIILQPGPAALTDGVKEMHRIFKRYEIGKIKDES